MGKELTCKILIIGDQAVGKTSFIIRYCDDKFMESYTATIGMNYKTKTVHCNDSQVKLHFFDPSGQERYRSIPRNFYKKADGVVLAFDCTDLRSFQNIAEWVEEIHRQAENTVPKVLVATKTDLHTQMAVSGEMGQQLANRLGIPFYETSSSLNLNVSESIEALLGVVVYRDQRSIVGESLQKDKIKSKKRCC